MSTEHIKFDCKYFEGHIPCKPNKNDGSVCETCSHYLPVSKRILIIKLGAIGDVIRTTPLLKGFRKQYPNAHFTWLTLTPDVLPKEEINKIYQVDSVSLFTISNQSFDIAINLDKDPEACILLSKVEAKEKYGFTYKNNHIAPATENAIHKLTTGIFDQASKENTKNYLEEIFEICHLEFKNEEYLIRINENLKEKWHETIREKSLGKTVIGLNTGCGNRWKTRLWPQTNWVELIDLLSKQGYFCMLLGGENEDKQNRIYAEETGAYYPGHFSLEEFIALTDTCEIVVTPVTLMMHIVIALKKQMILFNNIFNSHEFELYSRGTIIEPTSGCDCYYGNTCSREQSCMFDVSVHEVLKSINKIQDKVAV